MIVPVSQEFNHPSYGQNGNDGDITVVRLASALILGGDIQQASIMMPGFVMPAGWAVTYTGWGLTDVSIISRATGGSNPIFLCFSPKCKLEFSSLFPSKN
jgi:hypothetical protein